MSISQTSLREIASIISRAKIPGDDHIFLKLSFNYHLMVASEKLLQVARTESNAHCLLHLKDYFSYRLEEEKGHAAWMKEDLGEYLMQETQGYASMLAGSVYYLIYHVHPASLLGYMLMMEGFPMPMERIQMLEERYGASLLRTARYHADHDIEHGAKLCRFIDDLPSSEQAFVVQSARQCAEIFAAFMGLLSVKITSQKCIANPLQEYREKFRRQRNSNHQRQ